MTEVAFYHLTRSTLEQTLPKLLEKTLAAGKRAVVRAGSAQRVEALNGALWSYDPASWLPHGSTKDGNGDAQPVWLTDDSDTPNGAQFVFLLDGVTDDDLPAYERCFEIFDGGDPQAVDTARSHWKAYKEQGLELTYWQQTDSGGWQKKAT
ncbi:MAG TPA: DNA polymerase III subunit chi [Magnetovibrio sp.]